ncbi:MAG: asparagine synthase (glutamine-hydrolyzing) [Candidatus Cohnella colombiensis]|uniref:asparagine synthase (glutamine-hydrolyzing) n=1 Tax=Candidatus Cohnella colombiensis TaxID=3121368 RepID=A0AA95EX20_9BACL|nr:MAG: asparagine synthase (glutamine-hydrolyzing) [Cohnella sp.]
MCGFAGFANSSVTQDETAVIHKMMNTIRHRGPDSEGIYSDRAVTLGFRRLMIIDLSDDASQPMYNEDKSCVLVFNGEIYNYRELRIDLLEKGHVFVSHSDSEVIVHAYEEYGVDVLQKLRGMFAFAIWDRNTESLFIARDPFGIKPLYYTQNTKDQAFLFASEMKAFLPYPGFLKELNHDALKPFLTFQYSALDETFFKGVYKLQPGHYMVLQGGTLEVKRYSEPQFQQQADLSNLAKAVSAIQETVRESVNYHKISDVKVGSFLSGGIDSSYITALLRPDHTFTVGFQDYEGMFNETNLAQELSELLHIKNHRKLITADEFFERIPEIQYHMDEPHANLSSVPLYFLAELAGKHVTVVLSGEGADELFGGYVWYQKSAALKRYEKLPLQLRRGVRRLSKWLPANRITTFLVNAGQTVEERFIGQAKVFEEHEAVQLLQLAYHSGPSIQDITGRIYNKVQHYDDVSKMQYLDLHLWLPGDILLKADKMSMAHSLELRVPFLDKEVMKVASGLPPDLRVNAKDTKFALRLASKEAIPEQWANREKVGFPVPIRHWLKEEKVYERVKVIFEADWVEQFFNQKLLVRLLESHYTGQHNNARQIWTVYAFLIWYDQYFIER